MKESLKRNFKSTADELLRFKKPMDGLVEGNVKEGIIVRVAHTRSQFEDIHLSYKFFRINGRPKYEMYQVQVAETRNWPSVFSRLVWDNHKRCRSSGLASYNGILVETYREVIVTEGKLSSAEIWLERLDDWRFIALGKTYDMREALRSEGGAWDAQQKGWIFSVEHLLAVQKIICDEKQRTSIPSKVQISKS